MTNTEARTDEERTTGGDRNNRQRSRPEEKLVIVKIIWILNDIE